MKSQLRIRRRISRSRLYSIIQNCKHMVWRLRHRVSHCFLNKCLDFDIVDKSTSKCGNMNQQDKICQNTGSMKEKDSS